MTRDGFIELRLKHTGAFTKAAMPADILREMIANEVDFYIAAGMLKLGEPTREPSTGQLGRVRQFMKDFHLGAYSPGQLESALSAAGLKIVWRDNP